MKYLEGIRYFNNMPDHFKSITMNGGYLHNCDGSNEHYVSYRFNMADRQQRECLPAVIEKVIFNEPATIVFWSDKTKTVVKAENDTFDPEKGLAMAIAKKALGNQGNYYNTFKKWLPKEPEMDTMDTFAVLCKTIKGMNFNDLSSVFTPKGEIKKK